MTTSADLAKVFPMVPLVKSFVVLKPIPGSVVVQTFDQFSPPPLRFSAADAASLIRPAPPLA